VVRSAAFLVGADSGAHRDRWGVHDALDAYFAGDVAALDSIAVEVNDGTPFQRSVWKCLRDIPAGETVSYGELAVRVGSPQAARAVGMANAANPVPLIVPCHRVVRAGGVLGGYGYGPDMKRWLLRHEARSTSRPANELPISPGEGAFAQNRAATG
jgi:methylated-DNA-[protein]-cysteine S-methyltransferase